MPVLINNSRLVPSPLVTFGKRYSIADNGEFIGSDYVFTLDGNILPNQGNPIAGISGTVSSFSTDSWTSTYNSDDDPIHGINVEDRLLSIITKQEQIRDLLGPGTGVKVEVVGWNHNQGLKFVGRVSDLTFSNDGRWINPGTYSIEFITANFIESAQTGVFSSNTTEDNPIYFVSEANENWSIQESEEYVIGTGDFGQICKSYAVTHDVSAKGKPVYNSTGTYLNLLPWQQASGYVRQLIGLGTTPSGLLNPSGLGFLLANRKVVESVDRFAGTYSINEQFSYYNSGFMPLGQFATEDVNLSQDQGEDALTTVTIQGTVNGLERIDPVGVARSGTNKYSNALSYFNFIEGSIYGRALTNCGLSWLHPRPVSKSTAKNPIQGQISYNYTYNDRMPNLVPNSISESIEVSDTYPGQIIAIVPVIGRASPVLQYLNSRSEYRRNLNINVVMNPITPNWATTGASGVNSSGYWVGLTQSGIRNWFVDQKPSVVHTIAFSSIYEGLNPANSPNVVRSKVFYEAPQESWQPKNGQYNYSIGWIYEISGA